MIEKVLHRSNLVKAYRQVLANKGAAGVDSIPASGLAEHLPVNWERIVIAIANGSYLPQAILGVEVPKSNGKKRLLGSGSKSGIGDYHNFEETGIERL